MATKTFKIGESSYYGKWKLNVKKNKVIVQGIDYDTNKIEETTIFPLPLDEYDLRFYLEDISNSYFANKMIDWVENKIA